MTLLVLEPDHERETVEDGAQIAFTHRQRLLRGPFCADVDNHHAAFIAPFVGGRFYPDDGVRALGVAGQDDFAGGLLRCRQNLFKKLIKRIKAAGADKGGKAMAPFLRALDAEQNGAAQIQVKNHPFAIEREIGNRGKIVDVRIAVAQCIGFVIGMTQCLIVHFKLNLMDLKLVHQLDVIPR